MEVQFIRTKKLKITKIMSLYSMQTSARLFTQYSPAFKTSVTAKTRYRNMQVFLIYVAVEFL
jgi:hypothetical protein